MEKTTELTIENIEQVIIDTFEDVLMMSSEEQSKSRTPENPKKFNDNSLDCENGPLLIYPNYRNKTTSEEPATRMSEQELKQKLIEKLIDHKIQCFYSVETPSNECYNFKNEYPKVDSKGQSARFDLSLYNKGKKVFSHLEFKHGNVEESCITKDLLKLSLEPSELNETRNYFIHIIDGFNKRTEDSLTKKYIDENINNTKTISNGEKDQLYEKIREGLSGSVVIYLLVVRNQMEEYGGSQKSPVKGYFKLVYNKDTGLNWEKSWHLYKDGQFE